MNDASVQLYSAEWCGYCRALKRKLDTLHITYEYIDVDIPGNREQMNQRTGGNQTIPVLFVGENYKINPSSGELHQLLSSIT